MLEALLPLADATVAEEVTLIVPLGLFVVTLIWLLWQMRRRDRTR